MAEQRTRPPHGAALPDQTVRLRPVAGVAPGTYLTGLYGAVLLALLFCVAVLPGLRFNGALVTVSSSPPGAAVYVDGRFAGTTPVTTRVAAGRHTLALAKEHFQPRNEAVEVGGRLFLSWPFPRRESHHLALHLQDPAAAAQAALLDLARSPGIGRILTDAAADLAGVATADGTSGAAGTGGGVAGALLHNAMLLIEDPAGLAALLSAHGLLSAGGAPLSPAGLQRLLRDAARLDGDYPGLPLWFAALLPRAAAEALAAAPWYRSAVRRYRAAVAAGGGPAPPTEAAATPPPPVIEAAGMVFRRVPAGSFVMGDSARLARLPDPALPFAEWPHRVTPGAFYLQEREVTKQAFARFVAAAPEWAPGNRAALAERGLAAEDYLADWDEGRVPPGRGSEPVVYVSAHAAEAFAAWVGEQLPPAPGGGRWQVRLPFEPEWEYAARGGLAGQPYPRGAEAPAGHLAAPAAGLLPVGQSPPNGYGLRDLLGSVWEWTADWYSPTRYLLARDFAADYRTNVRFTVGSRRVVRGGSFTSDPQVVKVHTRGSQPAEWCTPMLGFRLLLVEP